MAASMPSIPAASVRAQITKFGSRRAATAARSRLTMSAVGTTALPSRWPHRLGLTWSSRWQPANPASSSSVMVRAALIGSPNPVSASISVGRSVTEAICAPRPVTSVSVVSPMSGNPRSADSTAPET